MRRGPRAKLRGLISLDVPEKVARAAANRGRMAAQEFRWSDGQEPEVRRLIGYYGAKAVGNALCSMNPVDVPGFLGDVDGYRRHCETYGFDAPKREAEPEIEKAAAWAGFMRGS